MARKIIVTCDTCPDTREPGEAEPFQTSIGTGREMSIDLCADCMETYVAPLIDIMRAHGVPADRLKPTPPSRVKPTGLSPKTYTCDACPDVSYTTMQPLEKHWRDIHNFRAPEAPSAFKFGRTCPVCGQEQGGSKMGWHAVHAHNVTGGIAALWREGSQQGDPFGVIEKQSFAVANAIADAAGSKAA